MSAREEDSAGEVREVREDECVRATVHRADYRSAGTHTAAGVVGGCAAEPRGGREPMGGSGESGRPLRGELRIGLR